MAYSFETQRKATANITKTGDGSTFKIAGVNGKQTSADNFHTAIMGLLHIVGKDSEVDSTGRTINQNVKEEA